jgi:hypothetical protein
MYPPINFIIPSVPARYKYLICFVGIECSLKDKKKANKEKWEKFLNHLAERSLYIPEKKDALMN